MGPSCLSLVMIPTLCDLLLYFISFVCAFAVYYVSKSAAIAWVGGWVHLRLCTHHLHPVFLPGLCVFRLVLSLYNFAFLQNVPSFPNGKTKDLSPKPERNFACGSMSEGAAPTPANMANILARCVGTHITVWPSVLATDLHSILYKIPLPYSPSG